MTCNERNFIRRLKKRDEDALDYIMSRYGGLVHAISYHILSNFGQPAVDECVNDVFLSIWQNADQFSGRAEDFKKWIGMIAKFKAIDVYRRLEKQQSREQTDEHLQEQPATSDIQTLLLEKEQKNALLLAVSELPEIDRDIFMMKYFLELSSQEIADRLGMTITAIDNRLYRGRKRLAQNQQLKERFI